MGAAILQGVPATTLDTDLWIDLPPRQYMRVLNLSKGLGATIRANTVVELADGSMVNFIYQVTGLKSFRSEYKDATIVDWLGMKIPVLPLDRIHKSKQAAGRPKDLAHLPLLEQTIRLRSKVARR